MRSQPGFIHRRRRQTFAADDYVFALFTMSRVVQLQGSGKRNCRLRQFRQIEQRIEALREERAQLQRVSALGSVLLVTGLRGYLDEAVS